MLFQRIGLVGPWIPNYSKRSRCMKFITCLFSTHHRFTVPACISHVIIFWCLNSHILIKMAIYSGFSHEKWWFSIAMLVHQRVNSPKKNNRGPRCGRAPVCACHEVLHSLDVSARQRDGPLQLLGDAVPRGNPFEVCWKLGSKKVDHGKWKSMAKQIRKTMANDFGMYLSIQFKMGKLWQMILGFIYQFNSLAISSGKHDKM